MITQQTYALLALHVYAADPDDKNKPILPPNWTPIEQIEGTYGFACTVYQNTTTQEIVISYRGTDSAIDWLTNAGVIVNQENQAAAVYANVLKVYGESANITFTGHSLGGGLAATMAVWFNRPAVVFDPAPSQAAATNAATIASVRLSLGADTPQSFKDYYGTLFGVFGTQFDARESNVTSYFAPGSVVYSLTTAGNTITGAGQDNPVQFGTDNMGSAGGRVNMHSQALLTAGLMSDTFRSSTIAVQRALPLIMDEAYYAYKPSGSDRNFLIDLIRSDETTPGNGKLSRFAADLNRLGTNISGLNEAAQKALIAQGIEWYYWQKNDYAQQAFFTVTGELIQYTSNQGDLTSLDPKANKAMQYTTAWLNPMVASDGGLSVFVDYEQWNVVAGSTATTATASDAAKSQVFVGGGGDDNFTGGTKDDLLLGAVGKDTLSGGVGTDYLYGGAEEDTLDGGIGSDWLYGGAGNDTYQLKNDELFDVITDSDGNGIITVDGVTLSGGKKVANNYWTSDDKKWDYLLMSSGDLIIVSTVFPSDRITVRNWQTAGGNQLGIVLDGAPADPKPPAAGALFFNGDQHAPLNGQGNYDWASTTWANDGTLNNGVPETNFSDVINASSAGTNGSVIRGYGGNDALSGSAGRDDIFGDEGDDLIGGGAGSDNIQGGAGNDYIFSAVDVSVPQRNKTDDHWDLPAGHTLLIKGSTWGLSVDAQNHPVYNAVGVAQDSAPDVIDAGDGDDQVVGGRGADRIVGGLGMDQLFGGGGNDIIEGGDDRDFIHGDGSINPNTVMSTAAPDQGNDFLDGGAGNDQIDGQGGNDTVYGGIGNDMLFGDALQGGDLPGEYNGNDYLDGEDGNDTQYGGGKDDTLYGGVGDDNLMGDAGRWDLAGAYHGNDYLDGEDGSDTLSGGGKDDTLFGGLGSDTMFGDAGTNLSYNIEGEFHGGDYLDGEDGDDVMYGDGKDDILIGGAGADMLFGDNVTTIVAGEFHGVDELDGGDGNDTLFGGGKDDTLAGGSGDDELQGDANQGSLDAQYHGSDSLDGGDGKDRLFGQGGSDTLYGGVGDDLLKGDSSEANVAGLYHGNDFLDGGDGADTLEGGGGADRLYGGAGNDILQGDGLVAEVAAQWHGVDYLDGGDGDDYLYGAGGSDTLLGGAGSDGLFGEDGDDSLIGGTSADYLSGGVGNDILEGDDGNDTVDGGLGDDRISGGVGNDSLLGSGGDDVLDGGQGGDYLSVGDTGHATVLFGRGDGHDILNYFANGQTTIRFKDGITAADLKVYKASTHAGLVVSIAGTSDYIDLLNNPFVDGSSQPLVFQLADGTPWVPTVSGVGKYERPATSSAVTLTGTEFSDILISGPYSGSLYGGGGDDLLYSNESTVAGVPNGGTQQSYVLYGEAGNDQLTGGINNDYLNGGVQNDVLIGDAGDDRLDGGDGEDLLDGGTGDDWLGGGSGSNTIVFARGYGKDTVDASRARGGDDVQTIFLSGLNPGDIQLRTYLGQAWDPFEGLEISVVGTTDSLRVKSFFTPDALAPTDLSIDQLKFQDGTIWSQADIRSHLNVDSVVLNAAGAYLTGGAGNDVLNGNSSSNYLNGGSGNDAMTGGLGDDTYYVGEAGDITTELLDEGLDAVQAKISWTLGENVESLVLVDFSAGWTPLNIDGTGNALNNTITGNAGNNVLDGGLGTDTLIGGLGNDTYYVDNSADVMTENADGGIDTVVSSVTRTLGANLENLTLGGTSNINGTGNSLANVLTGNAGNNTLNGGAGVDTLQGGAGNDTYTVDETDDAIIEFAGGGTDTVNASDNYTLSANVEALTLTGTSDMDGTGNSGDNTLTGNAGVNELTGDSGNDIYVVGAGDTTIELAGGGVDTVKSAIAWTLSDEVENLTLTGSSAVNGIGNALDNILTGNSGVNVLTGGAGNDTYVVGTGDTTIETAGGGVDTVQSATTRSLATVAEVENLTLTGTSAINGTGNALANTITGNAGNNVMDGGAGNDVYLIGPGGGQDTIQEATADASAGKLNILRFTAGVNSTNAVLARVGSDLVITFTGNTSKVTVKSFYVNGDSTNTSNPVQRIEFVDGGSWDLAAINQKAGVVPAINGTAGADTLIGTAAADVINGLAGNDSIDGGAGADTLVGGVGNDIYYVDNTADVTTEAASAGTDLVMASVNWTLATNLENLTLTGTDNLNGTGNTAANVITGNAGDNILDGGTGTDTLIGGAGNDTYVINVAADIVTEITNEGTDTVKSAATYTLGANLENLTLTGTSAINGTGNGLNNTLIGNSGGNILTGGAGDDVLDGGAGIDTLKGGTGNDTYFLDVSSDVVTENASEGTDTVNAAFTYTLSANLENLTLTGSTAINGVGNTGANALVGNTGANTLTGNAGNDTLDGKEGADSLIGGTGNDTYKLGRGYGADTITENDATVGNTDVALFDTGITTDQLWFLKVGNNLEVDIIGTSDKFTLTNWYLGNQYHVEQFKTSDGKVLLDSQVQALVDAMAAFSPPAAGQTTLTADVAATLSPVLAANWH